MDVEERETSVAAESRSISFVIFGFYETIKLLSASFHHFGTCPKMEATRKIKRERERERERERDGIIVFVSAFERSVEEPLQCVLVGEKESGRKNDMIGNV